MIKSRCIFSLLLAALLSLLMLTAAGCSPERDLDKQLRESTGPFRFDIVGWEFGALAKEVGKLFSPEPEIADNTTAVFFSNAARIKQLESAISATGEGNGDTASLEEELGKLQRQNSELAVLIERLVETQVREAFSRQGIYSPLDRYLNIKIGFPPVNINLAPPPHLLVVSPRDSIDSIREVTLLPDMSVTDMEGIEAEIDSLGVSSLVVNLGGISTYPSYVTDKADIRFILDTAAEEWLHQYLAFTPLGFRYVLDLAGINRDYDIATMNETVAGMVSKEIGGTIYSKCYAEDGMGEAEPEVEPVFDFNKEMREIRKAVDAYLAAGEIERAEEFMEQKRQYLAENGYYIRKLNQAYFAFHGAYADSPTSISPIGAELKELRDRSDSLKDFLDTVAGITSRRDLAETISP